MPENISRTADNISIADAAQLLREGRLVAFPTETVYGLGADASNVEAVKGIFRAKGRPADHPLIVHIPESAKLSDWAENIPEVAYILAEHFWPGPLAMILPKKTTVPLEVTGGQNTVALRIPNHPIALKLLQAFDGGIAAPSANRYCRISPTTAQHVLEELGNAVDLILDGGACSVGVESTIIDLTSSPPRLLRPGHISYQELEAVLQSPVAVPEILSGTPSIDPGSPRAPGMMALHYAPETKTWLCSSETIGIIAKQLQLSNQHLGLLRYRTLIPDSPNITQLTLPEQPDSYAQGLYAALRQLDELQLDILLIERPPLIEAWRAVNDRLNKAATLIE